MGCMQFVEGFVVLSWSVSLWAKILWEFYPRMYGLYPFIQKMSRVSPPGSDAREQC